MIWEDWSVHYCPFSSTSPAQITELISKRWLLKYNLLQWQSFPHEIIWICQKTASCFLNVKHSSLTPGAIYAFTAIFWFTKLYQFTSCDSISPVNLWLNTQHDLSDWFTFPHRCPAMEISVKLHSPSEDWNISLQSVQIPAGTNRR